MKYRPYIELAMRLRNLENTDPFEGIQEKNVCIEDILGLSTIPGALNQAFPNLFR